LACERFVDLTLEIVARPGHGQLIGLLLAYHSVTQRLKRGTRHESGKAGND
jgi:hypothetical protein